MKIDLGKAVQVATLVAMAGGGAAWAWQKHNDFLMSVVSPLLRSSYAGRIRNYRELECMGSLTAEAWNSYQEALADYEALVGRPISPRECDTFGE